MVTEEKKRTGFPSIDQPWNAHYSDAALNMPLPEDTMYRYLLECNLEHMDDTALIYFGTKITYRRFFENIREAAKSFTAIGVQAGDVVTIFSSNTPETVYSIFALNMIGALPSMEYVTVSDREAVAAVEHSESKFVLVLDVLLPKFEGVCASNMAEKIIALPLTDSMPITLRAAAAVKMLKQKKISSPKVLRYSDFLKLGKDTEIVEIPYRKGTPAVIVHSGGTTGVPKGVLLSNESLVYIAWAFLHNSEDAKRCDTYMAYIPLFHAFGLGMGLLAPLSQSMRVVLSPKFDEASLLRNFKKYKPNHIMASGAHMPALMNDPIIKRMDLSFFRTCGYGGSPLTKPQEEELVRFLAAHNSIAKASAGYGMSELSSAVCCERNCFYGKVGSVGLPLCRANVKVLDVDTGEELGYNQSGELCFSTPGLMLSYFKNEKETQNAFFYDEDGTKWIHTGDVGMVDEDGFVFITGRIKRIYSTRAEKGGTMFKIFPDYVASVINEVESVADSAVVCVEHPDYRYVAIAYIVLKENVAQETAKAMILDHMREVLPSHCIPKALYFRDSLPLTQIGKHDFHALEEKAKNVKIR